MKIKLEKIAKRYRLEWILRNVNLEFETGVRYAITGPNGSGKSTLLKLLSGHLSPTKGKRYYTFQEKPLDLDLVYPHLSYAAPYLDLIEEFTLKEAIDFHQKFKPFYSPLDTKAVIDLLGFERSRNKYIRNFSSGMQQRLKLALAICSDTPLLLLDEPTTNLDQEGANWYHQLIKKFTTNRLLIVASNVESDLQFCDTSINILDFK